MIALAPAPVLANPSGFLFVPPRGPDAPVASLIELPYSRTASPQVLLVVVMLGESSQIMQKTWVCCTHLVPAPLPAPATPFPTAFTIPPVKLLTPAAAAFVYRAIQVWPCGCWGAFFVAALDVLGTGFAGCRTGCLAAAFGKAFGCAFGRGFLGCCFGGILMCVCLVQFTVLRCGLDILGLRCASTDIIPPHGD